MDLQDRKDVYLSIAKNADDRTILNMLCVNKKFSDPEFFKQVFQTKYPFLIKFKKEEESWKEFYVKMIFYISKIEERGFPYIPSENYDPRVYYEVFRKTLGEGEPNRFEAALLLIQAVRANDVPFVKYLLNTYRMNSFYIQSGLQWAEELGFSELIDLLKMELEKRKE